MHQDLKRYNLGLLLKLYMKASREFSEALSQGASWKELKEKKARIKEIDLAINDKYLEQEKQKPKRNRDQPPHGD